MRSLTGTVAALAITAVTSVVGAQGIDTIWARHYSNIDDYSGYVKDAVLDSAGNFHLAGYIGEYGFADFLIVKFRSSGDTAWVLRYNGPASQRDFIEAIALDGAGNVYVTGPSLETNGYESYLTIKCDSSGNIVWDRRYDDDLHVGSNWPHGIAVDISGNVIVTGKSCSNGDVPESADFLTIKYSSAGDSLWSRLYDGPGGGYDEAFAVTVDSAGSIFVSGSSAGDGTGNDLLTIKYNPDGDTVWTSRYNGPGGGNDDDVSAIALDDSGNVFIAGSSQGATSGDDATVVKYRSDGVIDWTCRYDGPAGQEDVVKAMVLGFDGSVYVVGYSRGVHHDWMTIKIEPDGDTAWVRRFNGTGNEMDWARDVTLDAAGNVYVIGNTYRTAPTLDDMLTIKYTPTGETAWEEFYDDCNCSNYGQHIGFDAAGNLYVAGTILGPIWSEWSWLAVKYRTCCHIRGDVDHSGQEPIDIADIVYLVDYMFTGGPEPVCWDEGDIDASGVAPIDVSDLVYFVEYMFLSGPEPLPCNAEVRQWK